MRNWDADAEELGFALDIDNDGCFNAVTYNGVALGNSCQSGRGSQRYPLAELS